MKMHHDRYRIVLEHKAEDLRWSLRRRDEIAVERAAETLEETILASERESATQDLERTSCLLRQVEAALTRLRTANYGSCLKCEEAASLLWGSGHVFQRQSLVRAARPAR